MFSMVYELQVGTFHCVVLSDGQMTPPWEPPWNEFFRPETGVPTDQLNTALRDEGRNREGLALGYNCLCVETPTETILIDTGLGKEFGGYGPYITPMVGKLGDALSLAGIHKNQITNIVFTHLHQDHLRGCVWSGALTFPQATYIVTTAECAFWERDEERPHLTDHEAIAKVALSTIGNRLKQVEPETEVLNGIHTVAATGHTPGHMAILIRSEGERLLCVGDTFYDQLQVRYPDWYTPYDLNPRQSIETRRRLLSWAADEALLILAYHMPFPGLGYVIRDGSTFAWQPL